jgi:hypothetical protein
MGMSNDIKITISGNDAAMIAVWQRQQAEILKNQAALQKLGEKGEKAGEDISTGIDKSVESLTEFTTVAGLAAAGLKAIVKQYDDLKKRQDEAARRQTTNAAAEKKALINLGDDPKLSGDQYRKRIAKIAEKTGADTRDLHLAASSAFSAKGQLSSERALESVEEAAMLFPEDPAALETMAGASLDLQKKNPNMTGKQATGFMAALQGASRVKNLDQLAKNIVPAVVATQNFGDTEEQAGELAAGMSQALGDFSGEITKTATVQLASQLNDSLHKHKELTSTQERIEFIQKNPNSPEARKLFARKGEGMLHGEAQTLPAMRAMLTAGSKEADQLAAAKAAVPSAANAEAERDKLLKRIGESPLQQLADEERMLEAHANKGFLADKEGGRISVNRAGLGKNLDAAGVGFLGRGAAELLFEADVAMGDRPEEAASKQYRKAARQIRGEQSMIPGALEPNARENEQAGSLEALADKLDALIKLQDENNKIASGIEKGVDKGNDVVPKAGPGAANQRGN